MLKKNTRFLYGTFFQTGVCSVILLSTLYFLEFQYLMPFYNIQLRQYYIFQPESPHNIENETLMDLKHFEYLINNATICQGSIVGDQLSIVVIVHSARSHFTERYAVRNTWGSIKIYKGWTFHLVFLLGSDPNEEFNARLWQESQRYGDIIMGSFVDSYKNLTYKHLMG